MSLEKKTFVFLSLFALVFCACLDEKENVIRRKLDLILKDDLEAIAEDIDKTALLEKPYFEVLDYKEYKEGIYSRLAVVDFYFFNSINMKITRKYRYYKKRGLWDRYYNKYYMIAPETDETNGKVETD